MKKILLSLSLLFLAAASFAQNGLEGLIIEKYYVSNSTDEAGSIGSLPAGSVTYRFYADMLPGYKFQAAFGVPLHTLKFETTTGFFNNEDRGATSPTYTKTQARSNSVMLDSWFSVGAACSGNYGILKSEDNVTLGGATVVNSNAMLLNNDTSAGIPLTTQDGIYLPTGVPAPESVTFVGFTAADLDNFDATSYAGSSFITNNASWAALNGASGPVASTNKVLIAQITTDGVLSYELNIQIGTPTGGAETYVASNAASGEILLTSLAGVLGAANTLPTVSITSPADGANFVLGSSVTVNATAADADGSVTSVEFFANGVSIGVDNTAPFTANYNAASAGTITLTAVATDNNGGQTTSAGISIIVSTNPAPVVAITNPTNGASFVVGDVINIEATATDNGSVTGVEFFIDNISVGTDATAPYSFAYTGVLGSRVVRARATDNLGATTTSANVTFTVGNNLPPTVAITAPTNGTLITFPANVTINATANDIDGTVTSVEFFVNNVSIGSDATSPFSFSWTSVIGNANLTARATDNKGATTTSSVVAITIADPNALPYAVGSASAACSDGDFCVPVISTDSVQNVIGYDLTMNYDITKVAPTGTITLGNDLINSSLIDFASNVDAINGQIAISIFLKGSAPANASFNGRGTIVCVGFTKLPAFNPIDTAEFSVSSLQESFFTGVTSQLVDAGSFSTFFDTTFTGSLRFWSDNSPIRYNSANPTEYLATNIYGNDNTCNNKSTSFIQPDLNGNFEYVIANSTHITIEKDIAGITDVQPVINGFDALQVRKVLVNDLSFIPNIYEILSMDVNLDGFVSAGDVSQINQRSVMIIQEFKQAWNYNSLGVSNGQPSKDWTFVDSARINTNPAYAISTTYPGNDGVGFSKNNVPVVPFCLPVPAASVDACPVISNETYKAILIGDITGSYAITTPNNQFRTGVNGNVIIDLTAAKVENGSISVPVSFESTDKINAVDFAISFNNSDLVYKNIEGVQAGLQALANYNYADNTLRFTSNCLADFNPAKSVVNVKFTQVGTEINKADFTSAVAYLNGEKVGVTIIDGTSVNEIRTNLYPNPANDLMFVSVSEDAIVQIFDMSGKLVVNQLNVIANETNEISLTGISAGVYLVKVYNAEKSSFKKLVVKK